MPPNQPPKKDEYQGIDDIAGWGYKTLTKQRKQGKLYGINTNCNTQGNYSSGLGW